MRVKSLIKQLSKLPPDIDSYVEIEFDRDIAKKAGLDYTKLQSRIYHLKQTPFGVCFFSIKIKTPEKK